MTRNELILRLEQLAREFKGQTQEQYSSNENVLALDALMDEVHRPFNEYWRMLHTVWFSSKMADKSIIALTLNLIAEKVKHEGVAV